MARGTAAAGRVVPLGIPGEIGRPLTGWQAARDENIATAMKILHYGRMANRSGLADNEIIAFVNIVKVEEAKHFYGDVLGLRLVSEELPFALVFDAKGTMLRLSIAREAPKTAGTVLGWKVTDIHSTAETLQQAGVQFQRYSFLEQDSAGVWAAPGGAKVAWFLDPDGNTLSISQHEA